MVGRAGIILILGLLLLPIMNSVAIEMRLQNLKMADANDLRGDRSRVSSSHNIFSITEYCPNSCASVAEQTKAFLAAATEINKSGGGLLYVPQFAPNGHSWSFDSRIAGPIIFTVFGASIKGDGPSVVTVTGGNFAAWTTVPGNLYGGKAELADISLYEIDNPTSGAQLLLDRTGQLDISNVHLEGGFISLDAWSISGIHATNLTIGGCNSTQGASLMRIRRADGNAIHSAENNFTNLNLRAGQPGCITNALQIQDSDGLFIVNGHLGFVKEEVVRIQAERDDDQLDNIHFVGTDLDGGEFGLRFAPYPGFKGVNSNNFFIGGLIEGMSIDGIRIDDPSATAITLSSIQVILSGHWGINIQAGHHILLTGGTYTLNNSAGQNAGHIHIGGGSSHVGVFNSSFFTTPKNMPVDYNIEIDGQSDYVQIKSNMLSGARLDDIHSSTSGKHLLYE